jgi:DNA repair protein RecO (recombination protein O)
MPRVADRGRTYRTEAVILRRQNLGEADRLVTLFAPDHGKLRGVAKGVRRPGSRKAGHLEPFAHSRLLLARGRELDIITQAETIDSFAALRLDLARLGHAAIAIELMDRFGVQESDSRELFQLLIKTLGRIEQAEEPEKALRYFQVRLLDLSGYRPELSRCTNCGKEAKPEDQFFAAMAGGLLCPECGPTRGDARPLSLRALKVLRHYQRHPYPQAAQPRISGVISQELEATIESYLNHLLERELRAPKFVRQVRRLQVER